MVGSCRCLKENLDELRIERVCYERVTRKPEVIPGQNSASGKLSSGSGPNGFDDTSEQYNAANHEPCSKSLARKAADPSGPAHRASAHLTARFLAEFFGREPNIFLRSNSLRKRLAPQVGFEPTTYWLPPDVVQNPSAAPGVT